MKKYLLFILVLLVPFFVKADIREIKPVTEYNTGYAQAFYKDGYIYGIYGRADTNNLIEKMTAEGETVYKIETEFPNEDHEPIIFNDKDYFYIVELVSLDDENFYDIYVYKYDLKTGELENDVKIEDYYIVYSYNELITDDENIIIFNSHDVYATIINMETFDTTQVNYDETDLDGGPLYEKGFVYDLPNTVDQEGHEEIVDFIVDNDIFITSDGFETKDFYFASSKTVNGNTLLLYADKNLEDYSYIELKGGYAQVRGVYQYNNKLLISYEINHITCVTANHPVDSYYPGVCGGTNSYIALYDVVYNIYTKSDGNGEVKVSSESGVEGEGVTFEIIPKEGYVLSEVKVIDADGNVIKFTDYKFTMPTSDVTIEAVFVKGVSNPVTKDLIIYIAVIAVLSFIALTIIIKEMKREKKLTV